MSYHSFNDVTAKEELFNFLEVTPPEGVAKFREVLFEGCTTGETFGEDWEDPEAENGVIYVACFTGRLALINNQEVPTMYNQAGYRRCDGALELELAANNVEVGDTPSNNKVLELVVGWVDEFLINGKDNS
jgi:hypothetical protein